MRVSSSSLIFMALGQWQMRHFKCETIHISGLKNLINNNFIESRASPKNKRGRNNRKRQIGGKIRRRRLLKNGNNVLAVVHSGIFQDCFITVMKGWYLMLTWFSFVQYRGWATTTSMNTIISMRWCGYENNNNSRSFTSFRYIHVCLSPICFYLLQSHK